MGRRQGDRELFAPVTTGPASPLASSSKAIWLGIGLSVVAVVALVWRVSFRDVARALSTANVVWLLPALGLFFIMFGLRAWRWSVLLGGTRFMPTWHANIIGYFFNVTLPLRLGEIARCYVISKNTDVSFARAVSAVLVERLIDLGSVLLLFAWFARQVPMRASFTHAATIGSAAIVICLVVAVFVAVKGEALERVLAPRLARLGKTRADAWLKRSSDIRAGLRSVGSAKRIAQAVALTALIWAFTILIAAACLQAFLPTENDLTRAGFVVVIANLGGALPSAPAGLGVVQGFATSALVVPFGVEDGQALAYVLVWTLGQQFVLIVLGFVSLGRVGLSFRQIRAGAAVDPSAAAD